MLSIKFFVWTGSYIHVSVSSDFMTCKIIVYYYYYYYSRLDSVFSAFSHLKPRVGVFSRKSGSKKMERLVIGKSLKKSWVTKNVSNVVCVLQKVASKSS